MDYKQFGNKYVVRIDRGEEVINSIMKVCTENNIKLGSINGLGAADNITLGLFDTNKKEFVGRNFTGEYEIPSITGNISTKGGEIYLHIHATIADKNLNCFGGHLSKAVISGTCELILEAIDGSVERELDENIGLNLYKF